MHFSLISRGLLAAIMFVRSDCNALSFVSKFSKALNLKKPIRLFVARASNSPDGSQSKQELDQSITRTDLSPNVKSARAFLFAVPVVWGTYTPAIKYLYKQMPMLPAMIFNMLSYFAALTSILSTSLFSKSKNAKSKPLPWRAGVELGTYLFFGSTLQVLGIQHTSASRAAVLVQISSLTVPIFEAVLKRQLPPLRLWIAKFLSILGILILSGLVSGSPGLSAGLRSGDFLILGAALAYTLHIVRLSYHSSRLQGSSLELASVKSATELVLSLIAIVFGIWKGDAQLRGFFHLCLHTNKVMNFLLPLILVVLWNGAVCTAFPMWAQAVGQASVGPTEASLIYATQPVWGAAISVLFLSERLAIKEMIGLGLVLSSIPVALSSQGRRTR